MPGKGVWIWCTLALPILPPTRPICYPPFDYPVCPPPAPFLQILYGSIMILLQGPSKPWHSWWEGRNIQLCQDANPLSCDMPSLWGLDTRQLLSNLRTWIYSFIPSPLYKLKKFTLSYYVNTHIVKRLAHLLPKVTKPPLSIRNQQSPLLQQSLVIHFNNSISMNPQL